MRIKERLYVTSDRKNAVKESDRRGRYLLCKKGTELDDKIAEKYGIVDGYLVSLKVKEEIIELDLKVENETKAKAKAELKVKEDAKNKDENKPTFQIVPPETRRV